MGQDQSEIRNPVREQVEQTRDRLVEGIQNPLGMALGAAAVGFLVGLIVPVTPVEQQALPRVRDRLSDQMKAVDLMERAGKVLDETKRAAVHAVDSQAREASQALSQTMAGNEPGSASS